VDATSAVGIGVQNSVGQRFGRGEPYGLDHILAGAGQGGKGGEFAASQRNREIGGGAASSRRASGTETSAAG
jgi:hypothetical protein